MFAIKETKSQTNLHQNTRKPTLARKCTGKDCPLEKETSLLQRRANLSAPTVNEAPPIVHDVLRSSGQPLDNSTRAFMEPRFNQDFSHVRVHTDAKAAESAHAVNALAYTVGRDIVMRREEYAPTTTAGKRLLAHELAHVVQQGGSQRLQKLQVGAVGDVYEQEADRVAEKVVRMSELQTKFINNTDSAQTTDHPPIQSVLSSQQCGLGNQHIIQRWQLGTAPAPHGWNIVTDPEHLRRLQQAENHVRNLLTSRNCRNYFRDNCTNGAGANALQQAFDNAKVYLMLADNNTLGASDTSNNIAFNLRTFRIGHWMMASTLLHEMFHTCDPNFDIQDELDAENAIETCRLHTPWIDNVSPSQGAIGSNVTITGFSFGPTRDPAVDEVHIGGVPAPVISWNFAALGSDSSLETIVVTVPNGAAGRSGIVVINNRVRSNIGRFTVV